MPLHVWKFLIFPPTSQLCFWMKKDVWNYQFTFNCKYPCKCIKSTNKVNIMFFTKNRMNWGRTANIMINNIQWMIKNIITTKKIKSMALPSWHELQNGRSKENLKITLRVTTELQCPNVDAKQRQEPFHKHMYMVVHWMSSKLIASLSNPWRITVLVRLSCAQKPL